MFFLGRDRHSHIGLSNDKNIMVKLAMEIENIDIK